MIPGSGAGSSGIVIRSARRRRGCPGVRAVIIVVIVARCWRKWVRTMVVGVLGGVRYVIVFVTFVRRSVSVVGAVIRRQ